jgi:hypothetical protein
MKLINIFFLFQLFLFLNARWFCSVHPSHRELYLLNQDIRADVWSVPDKNTSPIWEGVLVKSHM